MKSHEPLLVTTRFFDRFDCFRAVLTAVYTEECVLSPDDVKSVKLSGSTAALK